MADGQAQITVFGPDFLNAAYDKEGSSSVGYTDDAAALVAARVLDEAQIMLNRVTRAVIWMHSHGLTLAVIKTELVVITKKRILIIMIIRVGDEVFESEPAFKYIGVITDSKMSFFERMRRTVGKTERNDVS